MKGESAEIRTLKREIIRLNSLTLRAAEEIRLLDTDIIALVKEFGKPAMDIIGQSPDDLYAGQASINLLDRLEGKRLGDYINNYPELAELERDLDHEEESSEHSEDCSWHRDWSTCNCGFHDEEQSAFRLRIARIFINTHRKAFEKLAKEEE